MIKHKLLHTAAVVAAVLGLSTAVGGQANARTDVHIGIGLNGPDPYFYGGRNYCWYDGGWDGPGFYWCGFAWRRGYGWGGPYGWRGWGGEREWREHHDNGWHNGWRGGDRRGEWRGGDRGGEWRGHNHGRGEGRGHGDGDHGGDHHGGDHHGD